MDTTKEIIATLRNSPGINVLGVVDDALKKIIREREEKRNTGVFACLEQPQTLLITHDGLFRPPTSDIVQQTKSGLLFPPVSFPEIPGAISSSPSPFIHETLINKLNLSLHKEEATLLIGIPQRPVLPNPPSPREVSSSSSTSSMTA